MNKRSQIVISFIKDHWKGLSVVFVIFLIAVPKIIDWLFAVYLCDLTTMNYLKAGDILEYFGTVLTIVATFIGIIIAISQFKLMNKTLIIPLNQRYFFYYGTDYNFLSPKKDIPKVQHKDYLTNKMPQCDTKIELKNIGKGNAVDFNVKLDYSPSEIILQKLSNNTDFSDRFDKVDYYENCGICLSDTSRYLELTNTFYGIIKTICLLQYRNYSDHDVTKTIKNNILLNTQNKICTISITSSDFLDTIQEKNECIYGVYLSVSSSISLSAELSKNGIFSEVWLTMKKEK